MLYSPKIKEEYIPLLYRDAKRKHKPMTKLVNEVIAIYFLNVKCCECHMDLQLDEPSDIAFCPNCDCDVFVER